MGADGNRPEQASALVIADACGIIWSGEQSCTCARGALAKRVDFDGSSLGEVVVVG